MKPDGSAGVQADIRIGAEFPHLLAIGLVALGLGLALLTASGAGAYLATRRR
jgi:hypothetical protein